MLTPVNVHDVGEDEIEGVGVRCSVGRAARVAGSDVIEASGSNCACIGSCE
jgi:hypothetical protein